MEQVKVKGIPFKLAGEVIKIGGNIDFTARDMNNRDWKLSSVKGYKILSVFPDINTRVCDLQTHEIAKLAAANPRVHIISVTMDPVEVIKGWCAANGINNLTIVSDQELKQFAKQTNMLVTRLNKLARAFILVDDKNRVKDMSMREDLSEMPDLAKLSKWALELAKAH